MLSKNDLFRSINTRSPDIVERLITLWGGPDLGAYISDMLSCANGKPELREDIRLALSSLKAEHDREFPQFCVRPATVDGGVLAENAAFMLVKLPVSAYRPTNSRYLGAFHLLRLRQRADERQKRGAQAGLPRRHHAGAVQANAAA